MTLLSMLIIVIIAFCGTLLALLVEWVFRFRADSDLDIDRNRREYFLQTSIKKTSRKGGKKL